MLLVILVRTRTLSQPVEKKITLTLDLQFIFKSKITSTMGRLKGIPKILSPDLLQDLAKMISSLVVRLFFVSKIRTK